MRERHRLLALLALAHLLAANSACGDSPAQVTWKRLSTVTGELPAPNHGQQQTCCIVLDVDKDGIDDFVVGERTRTPSVVWYKYHGNGWDRHVIDNTPLRPEAGAAEASAGDLAD